MAKKHFGTLDLSVVYYSVTNSTRATQRFSANQKTSWEQKNQSLFISDWLGIDAKGNVKVDYDSSIYHEVLFIFITEKKNKYFLNGGPKTLRNRRNICTEWRPRILRRKLTEWILRTYSRTTERKYKCIYQMMAGILKTKRHETYYQTQFIHGIKTACCTCEVLKN